MRSIISVGGRARNSNGGTVVTTLSTRPSLGRYIMISASIGMFSTRSIRCTVTAHMGNSESVVVIPGMHNSSLSPMTRDSKAAAGVKMSTAGSLGAIRGFREIDFSRWGWLLVAFFVECCLSGCFWSLFLGRFLLPWAGFRS